MQYYIFNSKSKIIFLLTSYVLTSCSKINTKNTFIKKLFKEKKEIHTLKKNDLLVSGYLKKLHNKKLYFKDIECIIYKYYSTFYLDEIKYYNKPHPTKYLPELREIVWFKKFMEEVNYSIKYPLIIIKILTKHPKKEFNTYTCAAKRIWASLYLLDEENKNLSKKVLGYFFGKLEIREFKILYELWKYKGEFKRIDEGFTDFLLKCSAIYVPLSKLHIYYECIENISKNNNHKDYFFKSSLKDRDDLKEILKNYANTTLGKYINTLDLESLIKIKQIKEERRKQRLKVNKSLYTNIKQVNFKEKCTIL